MQKKPSQRFTEWLDSFIAERPPGTRLPTIAALASTWGIAEITANRLIRPYKKEGKLCCIQGKGTFTQFAESSGETPEPATPRSSVDDITYYILDSIKNGAIRVGDALPAVKYLSLQFKVAPPTVIAAYRRLIKQRFAYKIGKTFWAGNRDSLNAAQIKKQVVVFYEGSARTVYKDDHKFTGQWMGQAYRKMERELLSYGYELVFEPVETFGDRAHAWRSKKDMPYGVLLHKLGDKALAQVLPSLKCVVNTKEVAGPAVVVDWVKGGGFKKLPAVIKRISRGNIQTRRARLLANQIILRNYRAADFYFDESKMDFEWFTRFIRIQNELDELEKGFAFRIVVKPRNTSAHAAKEAFMGRLAKRYPPEMLAPKLSRHGRRKAANVDDEIEVARDFRTTYRSRGVRKINIFLSDSEALESLQWARDRGIAVPKHYGVVSLENNDAYLHERISCCVPDWEGIGYLMAHAIINDFPIEKTSLGFLSPRVMMMDRGTM
jgi:DNA-binding transcriptional regulator YhcF (GntR family)